MDTPIPGDMQNDQSGAPLFPSSAGSAKIPAVRTLEGDAARLGVVQHTGEVAPSSQPSVSSDGESGVGFPSPKTPRDPSGAIVIPSLDQSGEEEGRSDAAPASDHAHVDVPHKPSVAASESSDAAHPPRTLNELLGMDIKPGAQPEGDTTVTPGAAEVTYTPPESSLPQAETPMGDPSLVAEVAAVQPEIVPPPAPVIPEKSFEEQIADLERDVKALEGKRKEIEEHTSKLFATRRTIEETLAPIQKEAKEIAAEIARIEEAEKKSPAGSEERREHEKKRWEAIEKSRSIDERKWKVKENLEGVLNDITTEENAYQTASDEESSIRERIEKLHVEAKRRDLNAELDKIIAERGTAQEKLDELAAERVRVESMLHEAETKEAELEGEVAETTKKLSSVKSLGEERMLADARYRLEKERHEVEEERWRAEDDIKHVRGDIGEATKKLEEIKKREEVVKNKLDALPK